MESSSDSQNRKDRQPWNTQMMIDNRDRWNLAADVGVLEYLRQFGDKVLNETENTLNLLDSFEAELNTSCVQVSNITNRFLSLADSQFVENRVYDDEETPTPESANVVPSSPPKSKQEIDAEIFNRLKESVVNGLNVLDTKFEAVEVANSDSEDDDSGPMGIVYKPLNPFNSRPLPHLIGSVEFMKDPTVGLEELPSDDEESIEEESSSESKELTEENEDSEPESDRPDVTLPKQVADNNGVDLLYKQTSTSFADHIAERLVSMENESRLPKKQTRNLFSTTPPPLDDLNDDEFGSNDDLIFGGNNQNDFRDNDDLFLPNSNTSLWGDSNTENVRKEVESPSDNNRKKVMQDLEKRLSQNFKSNIGDSNYDCLSPSPPPLTEDLNEEYRNSNDNIIVKNKDSSLFSNNPEDNDECGDLFGSTAAVADKKKIFPGAVNVFGNNANIFKDTGKHQRNNLNHNNNNAASKSSTNEDTNKADGDILSKTITSIRRNYEDDDEDEDTIFKSNQHEKSSSRSSSVKLSESFQDDNLSIKSNKSASLFDDVLTNTKKNSIKKTMDDLFSDLNSCEDDDDLFSSNYSSKDSNNKFSDLFGQTSKSVEVLSGTSNSAAKKSDKLNIGSDLFGDIDSKDDLFSNFNDKKPQSNNKRPSNDLTSVKKPVIKKPLSLFDDEEDGTDIFSSDFLVSKGIAKKSESDKKISSSLNEGDQKEVPSSSTQSKEVEGLFENDVDIFGETTDPSGDIFSSDLFSKKQTTYKSVSSENNSNNLPSTVSEGDLFSNLDSSNEKTVINSNPEKPKEGNKVGGKDGYGLFDKENNAEEMENENQPRIVPSNNYIKTASVKPISLFSDDACDDFAADDDLFTTGKIPSAVISDGKSIRSGIQSTGLYSSIGFDDLHSNQVIDNKLIESKDNRLLKKTDSSLLNEENPSDVFSEKSLFPKETSDASKPSDLDDSPLFNEGDKNENIFNVQKDDDNELFKKVVSYPKSISGLLKNKSSSQDNLNPEVNDVKFIDGNKTILSEPLSTNDEITADGDLFSEKNILRNEDKSLSHQKNKISSFTGDNEGKVIQSSDIFNTDSNLPEIPAVKKPTVSAKPLKPEPPKTLSIRAPISTPDPFGDDSFKNTSSKLDMPDGCTFSSEASSSLPSPRITPGKLNLEKSLNINPKALLPGARPASFKKPSPQLAKENNVPDLSKDLGSESVNVTVSKPSSDIKEDSFVSDSSSSLPNTDSEPVLHSVAKDRAKIQVKRRPQTRKARREAVRQSTIENNYEDDETDNSSSITTQSNIDLKSTSSSIMDQPSNILSPSTDEEDLFGVPPLDLPCDYTKVSISPGDIFGAPTIISPDLNISSITSQNITCKESSDRVENSQEKSDKEELFKSDTGNKSGIINKHIKGNKENSDDIFNDVDNNKLSSSGKTIKTDKVENNFESNSLFNDLDDSDLFLSKPGILKENLDNDSDLFSSKPGMLKEDLDNDSDLFSSKPGMLKEKLDNDSDLFSSKPGILKENLDNDSDSFSSKPVAIKSTLDEINSGLDLFDGEQDSLKPKEDSNIADEVPDLSLHKSDKLNETSDNVIMDIDLKGKDASNNIICGVFNSGVVNICDKLSITPPNDDELFPPSDWTLNNKKEDTIISVPEKIKTDSLFVDNNYGGGDDDADDDDSLFSTSSTSYAKKGTIKSNNLIERKSDNDLFSNDAEDDDGLFGEVKTKTKPAIYSKSLTASSKESKDISVSKAKKSSLKTDSLFGDNDEDDDFNSIFASSTKSKPFGAVKNLQSTEDVSKISSKNSANIVKKSSSLSKPTKTAAIKNQDVEFVDPLTALGKND